MRLEPAPHLISQGIPLLPGISTSTARRLLAPMLVLLVLGLTGPLVYGAIKDIDFNAPQSPTHSSKHTTSAHQRDRYDEVIAQTDKGNLVYVEPNVIRVAHADGSRTILHEETTTQLVKAISSYYGLRDGGCKNILRDDVRICQNGETLTFEHHER
jgi:hypothetical protein